MTTPNQSDVLRITVVGANGLKDNNWIFRMLPYISLAYAGGQYQTGYFSNGGKNPRFNKKLKINVVEGFREVAITAWSKNVLSSDSFIGCAMIDITKALKDGFDDITCKLNGTSGKHVGDVKLILNFSNPEKYRRASILETRYHSIPEASIPIMEPSPPFPVTGYPPPSPYHPHMYPTSLSQIPTPQFMIPPPSPSTPEFTVPPPSAPYPPSESPSTSYDAPPLHILKDRPSVASLEEHDPPKSK